MLLIGLLLMPFKPPQLGGFVATKLTCVDSLVLGMPSITCWYWTNIVFETDTKAVRLLAVIALKLREKSLSVQSISSFLMLLGTRRERSDVAAVRAALLRLVILIQEGFSLRTVVLSSGSLFEE